MVTQNLKTLRAILNWATMAGDGRGGYLLERDPLRGLPYPKEPSTRRPIITDEQFQAILKVSREVSPLFGLALILAHETGHRIGSIRLLKWSDVDVERKTIRWRGENDKIGFDHETWLTDDAVEALGQARRKRGVIGDAWVFPAPLNASKPVSRHLMRDWWQQGEALAKVPHSPGLGWHTCGGNSLRR
ncbi:MAG: tyrosine-type recombinase/integrase [Gemmatimonadetes bacterium]|nr:tyrosine-type recombinase/integrase [Gemmatimonadota bacterium]